MLVCRRCSMTSGRFYVTVAFGLSIAILVYVIHDVLDQRDVICSRNVMRKPRTNSHAEPPVNDAPTNLIWFMQVTDLHLSDFVDPSRFRDFSDLCTHIVMIIKPELLSITGDLTDAKDKIYLRSTQSHSEWTMYSNVLAESGILKITKVLDLRGNHDAFGVVSVNHSTNLFGTHGRLGKEKSSTSLYTIEKPFGTYSFVYMDACPEPGLKFPLNFFGEITSADATRILHLNSKAEANNHTFWFGHYPTSTIVSPYLDLRGLLGKSAFAYLCGHLHTLAHLAPRMHTLQSHGYLELELGDWKYNRYFRIVAIDHDLVSLVDLKLHQPKESIWPIILVTNPKHSGYLLPHKEPAYRIAGSTHIRILVWSPSPIIRVSVFVDGHFQGNATLTQQLNRDNVPLYVLPWNASLWADEQIHTLRVEALDSAGNRRSLTQPFLVNAKPSWDFPAFASFVLQTNHTFNIRCLFYALVFTLAAMLVIPRWIPIRFMRSWCLFVGLHRFARMTSLSLPLLCYVLYLCIGPIFMGHLLENHFGFVFSWGIIISGTVLRETLTYFYESAQVGALAVVYLPGILWYCGTRKVQRKPSSSTSTSPSTSDEPNPVSVVRIPCGTCCCTIPLPLFFHAVVFTLLQLAFILVTIAIPYGVMAALLCPGRLTCIVLVWYNAWKLPQLLNNFHS